MQDFVQDTTNKKKKKDGEIVEYMQNIVQDTTNKKKKKDGEIV